MVERSLEFLDSIAALGVTTVECKSGYGLDLENELKLLRVYRRLRESQPLRIVATFLGAHVVPPELLHDHRRYIDILIKDMIPRVASQRLAAFCDVFVEDSAFTAEEARPILLAAQGHGLGAKLHADQLTGCGGAELAAEVRAVSADHLECVTERGIQRLSEAQVTAVSLPFASVYLGHAHLPARRLIQAGVPLAVATDFNPGSAPSYDLPLAMFLAVTLQRLTPAEALKAVTLQAARALRLEGEIGSLEPGKSADFALIDAPDVNHWLYHQRPNSCLRVFIKGVERSKPSTAPSGR